MITEHEHPLNLIDLWSEQLQHEKEHEEEDEESNEDEFLTKQDFKCLCSRCEEEINWFHRYYYTCCQCGYSIHNFCEELPEKYKDICHVHPVYFLGERNYEERNYDQWICNICRCSYGPGDLYYHCPQCDFDVDVKCAIKRQQKNIIYHPSHEHPLVRIPKKLLYECDACGMEHKGVFYHCPQCIGPFIHSHCAFQPKKLRIQHYTNDFFSHIHPLDLSYTFPKEEQESKFYPLCRVCRQAFSKEYLWIYKCEKCRYYTHLNCATSRNEPFMSILTSPGTGKIIKNYEDAEHPNLLRLPFPDPSFSLLKHLFFKKDGSSAYKTRDISHQHPLTLVDGDITTPTSSRIKPISYHDPMKRIQLLCDGCVRPITSWPIYVCANEEEEHCNFVLHEWCSRLPAELIDHPAHQQHTLILHSKAPRQFFGVFSCNICSLPCNGFVYCCMECVDFIIDVECAFLPKEITHTSHPNHVLSRVYQSGFLCRICKYTESGNNFSFSCHTCNDFHLHTKCALFIPETTMNKCDKHPMKLSYFPIENHKSDYFCEVCERELNPERPFYHCRDCMQSIHTTCAPSILQYETYDRYSGGVYKFVNVKFGGTYNNIEVHPHPLSFVQGIEDDGECASNDCYYRYQPYNLQYSMIFKCLDCKFAVHYECCERMSS
ncbi:putative chromatin regulator PHD family [Helianthus annuus]|nr:putative chromatin regulator PHD family [Helianthus annuus]KAJ0541328.1 putative chromatin regulator PHD family [Helianthus annuus]KAJ0706408.1 putative chromatin regulator PHD family [Helianthus annuus]KAJ0710447.1 putative chromatin regulator PHD family [Helianthus annuus]KAJ0886944.1 putative chromatin regulator PHD family [Helianthus annuus]